MTMTTSTLLPPPTIEYQLEKLQFYVEGRAIVIDLRGVHNLPYEVARPHVTLFYRPLGFNEADVVSVAVKAHVILGHGHGHIAPIKFTLEPYGPRSDYVRGELATVCSALRREFPADWNSGQARPLHVELRTARR